MANGRAERSIASATLASVPSLPPSAMQGHVMPSFTNSLIGLGPFVDMGCTVVFTATGILVIHPDGHSLLDGWREDAGARLWCFPLQPITPVEVQETPDEAQEKRNVAFYLPNDHVNRDSLQWQKVTANPGFLDAVLLDQVET